MWKGKKIQLWVGNSAGLFWIHTFVDLVSRASWATKSTQEQFQFLEAPYPSLKTRNCKSLFFHFWKWYRTIIHYLSHIFVFMYNNANAGRINALPERCFTALIWVLRSQRTRPMVIATKHKYFFSSPVQDITSSFKS
jgi:hypothetical protein